MTFCKSQALEISQNLGFANFRVTYSEPITNVENRFSIFDQPVFGRKLVIDSTADDVNCSALQALNTDDGSIPGTLECQGETFSNGYMVRPPVLAAFAAFYLCVSS